MAKHSSFHLTARSDIGPYRKGDHIEDEAEVTAILAGEHRHHFTRVAADNAPDEPTDAAPSAPAVDEEAE